MSRLRTLVLALSVVVLLAQWSPAAAQGTTPVRAPDSLEIVLGALGVLALIVIGFIYTVRSNTRPDDDEE